MKSVKFLVAVAALATSGVSYAATVLGSATTPTVIGTFAPGTYTFKSTGVVSLAGPVGSGFDIDPNGKPLPGSVTDPNYQYFNPNGSYNADGSFGPAGPTVKIGALAGLIDGTYFQLGTLSTRTFFSQTTVYGLVNDTYSDNNTGSFSVSAAAVPEPATWAMMLLGFGAIGFGLRRRRQKGIDAPRVRFAF